MVGFCVWSFGNPSMSGSLIQLDDTPLPPASEVSIPFAELHLDAAMVARALGYADGVVPEPFEALLTDVLEEAGHRVEMIGGYVLCSTPRVRILETGFEVDDQYFDAGRIIALGLKHADALAVYLVTAGAGYQEWMRAVAATGDPFRACLIDALGSEIVERAADKLLRDVEAAVKPMEWRASARYGPGYCDWKLAEQHQLFTLFPEGFCGVTLGESAIMQPMKSVSGVFALGARVKHRASGCSICTMENCFRRDKRK